MASSPFKLFRKYQKVLLIVAGVLAILVFTVGDSLMMIGRDQAIVEDMVIAKWSEGEIRQQDVMQWVMSRKRLALILSDLAAATRMAGATPLEQPLLAEWQVDERGTVYTMLLNRKAEGLGVTVSDAHVKQYLLGLTGNAVSGEQIAGIVTNRGWTIGNVYDAIRHEMKSRQVAGLFFSAADTATPAANLDYYLRVNRRVAADIVAFPVEDFLSEVADPSESELRDYFERFKEDEPQFDSFGRTNLPSPLPAFKQPRKAAVEYFFADFNKFVAQAQVTDEEMRKHYEENKEFYIEQQLPAATEEEEMPDGEAPADGESEEEGEGREEEKDGAAPPADQPPVEREPTGEQPQDGDESTESSPPADPPANDPQPPADEPASEDAPAAEDAPVPPAASDAGDAAVPGEGASNVTEGSLAPADPATEEPAADLPAAEDSPTTDEAPSTENAAGESDPGDMAPPGTEPDEQPSDDGAPAENSTGAEVDPAAAETETPAETEVEPTTDTPAASETNAEAPATGGADSEAPAAEEPPQEVKYKPFEEVQEDIRTLLARRQAHEKIDALFKELRARLQDYNIRRASVTPDMPESSLPVRPDFAAIAKAKGLESGSTELLSLAEFQAETGIGKSFDRRVGQFGQPVTVPYPDLLFQRTGPSSLFIPMLTEDNDANRFLSWKVEEVESKVPTLDEVRDQVVRSWKMGAGVEDDSKHARGLARAAAAAMAEEASSPSASLLELGRKAGRPQVETNLFSWIEPPLDMRSEPTVSLSSVNGVEDPGPGFFSVATGLGVGEIGVTMNHPQTYAYTVKVVEEEKALQDLMEQFLDRSGSRLAMMAAGQAMSFDWQEVQEAWLDDLEKQYGLQWQVDPDQMEQ